jgi:hypothetical protein
MRHLFEPFVQGERRIDRREEGVAHDAPEALAGMEDLDATRGHRGVSGSPREPGARRLHRTSSHG